MNAPISIADSIDAHAIVGLRTAVAHDMSQTFGAGPWAASPNFSEVAQQLRVSHALVARRQGEIVGTVRLVVANQSAIDTSAFTAVETALYVLGLAVAPDSRGMGVGRRLMDAAKDAARAWPAGALWLDAYDNAAGAGPFYIKCGFRRCGQATHEGMPLGFFEWLETDEARGSIR